MTQWADQQTLVQTQTISSDGDSGETHYMYTVFDQWAPRVVSVTWYNPRSGKTYLSASDCTVVYLYCSPAFITTHCKADLKLGQ